MKSVKFFLILGLGLVACNQSQDEEMVDIDQMVLVEKPQHEEIAKEMPDNPQETMIDDPLSVER